MKITVAAIFAVIAVSLHLSAIGWRTDGAGHYRVRSIKYGHSERAYHP